MTLQDLFLTPVYLFIIYMAAYVFRQKICKDAIQKKYFISALTVKILGAIFLGLIYQFYYQGGDTYNYFLYGSDRIYDAFLKSPVDGIRLIFLETNNFSPDLYEYTSGILWTNDAACYFVIRVSAIIGLFTFSTYTVNAIFFAIIGFSGVWALYLTLYKMYPKLEKELAIAIFFIPSVFFWGSGLMKDTLTLSAVGWFVYCFEKILIKRNFSISTVLIFIGAILVLKIVKIYILLCILPSAIVWLFFYYSSRIRSSAMRAFLKPVMVVLAVAMGMLAADQISKDDKKYSLDNLTHTAIAQSEWLYYVSKLEGGSAYTLGEFDPTPTGLLKVFPSAVWVTLFRPYIWESNNIVMLVSAFESTFFLIITILAIYRAGPLNTFTILKNNPFVFFAIVFSIIFSFAIGISTSNFGSLVRYKIPIMPFYLASIYIIRYLGLVKKRKKMVRMHQLNDA